MSERRLRLGVIGAGGFFDARAAAPLGAARNVTLGAVMVRDAARAAALAEKHGAAHAYATVDALLADPDLDAVYVVTPVCTHAPITCAAAAAGKHVLCEKPIALDVAESREMIAACRAAGVTLMPAFMSRFHPSYRALRERVVAGALGRIVSFRGRWGFHYPAQPGRWRQDPAQGGGGPLMDVGSHALDALRFWLGEAVEVAAFASTQAFDYAVEDTCTVLLRFASGAHGALESHFSVPGAANGFELLGTDGVALVPHVAVDAPVVLRTAAGEAHLPVSGPSRYTLMFEHFADVCMSGVAPVLTGDDGLRNMMLIDAAYRSAREHAFVKVAAPSG